MKVHRSQSVRRVKVTTDGEGLVSHAGTALLSEVADSSGLTEAMSVAMGDCGISWHTHDPGVVLTHLAVAIADGADCLSKLAVLRNQEALFGPVASHATAWRAVEAVASVELAGIDTARAAARGRIWAAGGAPGTVTLDFDATLLDAHSEKQYAAPTYKRGFGFHPLGVWCDETTEFLAGMLRPGNAGANSAADHVAVLDAALAQLPPEWRAGHGAGDDPAEVVHPILARADSAGATHGFVDALVERNIGFSIGFDVDGRVRDALLLVQEEDWVPAIEADGSPRPGAWVTELTKLVDLGTWPRATRLVCRRERPHPGAQLSLFDTSEGFRHTCFITASPGKVAPPGAAPTPPCPGGGPHPLCQSVRPAEPAVRGIRPQRGLVRHDHGGPGPAGLDGNAVPRRSTGPRRAGHVALPAAARRRPHRTAGPRPLPAHRRDLAMAGPARRRLRAPAHRPLLSIHAGNVPAQNACRGASIDPSKEPLTAHVCSPDVTLRESVADEKSCHLAGHAAG